MADLRELYQQLILDHSKHPKNFGPLPDADRRVEGHNPLCGDHLTLSLKLDGERIVAIAFEGNGCAISKASASIMTATVKGKSRADAETLFTTFHDMVTGRGAEPDPETMGKLAVFAGVREFPARVKCASLAWHTLKAALAGDRNDVSTE